MNLIASFKSEGKPQRQLVKVGNTLYRRIVALVCKDGIVPLREPQWQEQIHNGDFHNVFGATAFALEEEFNLSEFVF